MSSPTTAPDRAASDIQAQARIRRCDNWTIAVILALQIVMPLSYYVSKRSYDERFSWRMFSTLRLRDCKVEVREHLNARTRSVNIERDVHVAWLRLLERMRSAVVDAYLARRCGTEGVTSVDFVCHCNDTDGRALPAMERSLSCGEEVAP
jgi:hypothetical protein